MRNGLLFGVLLPLVMLASGCGQAAGDYPSLAIRDVEAASAPIPGPPPVPAPPTATLSQLDPLLAQARAAHAAFLNSAEAARVPVRAAVDAPPGSDQWSIAQIALADASVRRGETMSALADLDRLFNDAASTGESTESIAPVRGAVAALLAEEDSTLANLIGQLAR